MYVNEVRNAKWRRGVSQERHVRFTSNFAQQVNMKYEHNIMNEYIYNKLPKLENYLQQSTAATLL